MNNELRDAIAIFQKEKGISDAESQEIINELIKLDNIIIAGITSFPCYLYNSESLSHNNKKSVNKFDAHLVRLRYLETNHTNLIKYELPFLYDSFIDIARETKIRNAIKYRYMVKQLTHKYKFKMSNYIKRHLILVLYFPYVYKIMITLIDKIKKTNYYN